jgi:enoyl-CoA hydratase/carnithine racemase
MAEQNDQELLITIEDGVGSIAFNRPQVRNSLTPALLQRFISKFQQLEENDAVRVIVLTGVGKAFSSGGDMDFLRDLTQMTQIEIRTMVYRSFQGAARAIKLCSKPTIAAVNGPAIGAGCELAVMCDFRIVARDAYFCENWIEIGAIPPLGGMYLLPRLIGVERANNMILRATRVYGEEAKAIGLASEVVDQDGLADAVRAFAGDLARRPRHALAVARQGMRRGQESTLAGEWEFNVHAQSALLKGDDFGEFVQAMQEGRKPVF